MDAELRPRRAPAARSRHAELAEEQFFAHVCALQERVKAQGLWATHLPPELGGQGFGQVKLVLMHEIEGTAMAGPIVSATRRPTRATPRSSPTSGTAEQKERWLVPAARGRHQVGVLDDRARRRGLGSDVLSTAAVRDGDGWVLDGHKWFTSNGDGRRLPDRHGGHRPRRAAAPARLDVHRAGRRRPGSSACATSRHMGEPATASSATATPRSVYGTCGVPAENLLGDDRRRVPDRAGAARARGASTTACAGSGRCERAFDMMCERALAAPDVRRASWPRSRSVAELDRRSARRDAGGAADDAARRLDDRH